MYLQNGGISTVEAFLSLSDDEKGAVYDFLGDASVYETIEHGGDRYILLHAGIAGFDEQIPLEYYEYTAFLSERMDYFKRYIAIDCGCVYGGRLAAYCIETG